MHATFHIIGDAFVDLFCFLETNWPEQGGDAILGQPVKSYAGGSSTNTATHLASLVDNSSSSDVITLQKDPVILYTVLNPNDHYGQLLLKHAVDHKIPLVNCCKNNKSEDTSIHADVSTGHCMVIVSGGERTFMTHLGCVGTFQAADIPWHTIRDAEGPIHVHVAGYFNTTGFWHGTLAEQLRQLRHDRGGHATTVSLVTQHDASNEWDGGLDQLIQQLDYLIINELEACRITSRGRGGQELKPEDDRVAAWVSFFSPLNPKVCVVVTRGPKGAVAFRNGAVLATLRLALSVTVVDPTGAGDAFTAGFLYGLWSSKEETWSARALQQGLEWGCAVGTAVVTTRGASNPSELDAVLALYERQKANDA
jgi:sugar/nucleoside kinase (ribokinase family)